MNLLIETPAITLATTSVPSTHALATAAVTVLDLQAVKAGPGADIERALAPTEAFDPFLMADHFHMSAPTFAAHPHAGFSAVTYLFDDSETGFLNRDSLGGVHVIKPGALHWTLAGSGIQHEEVPLDTGRVAHGLQMFVRLPASHETMAPQAAWIAAEAMPRWVIDDARATLVFGRHGAIHAPRLPAPGDASLMLLDLPAGGSSRVMLQAGQQAVVIRIRGTLLNPNPSHETVGALRIAGDAEHDTQVHVSAGAQGARLAVLYGTPYRSPLVQHGPFAMSTPARLREAMLRHHSGAMGHIEPVSAERVRDLRAQAGV